LDLSQEATASASAAVAPGLGSWPIAIAFIVIVVAADDVVVVVDINGSTDRDGWNVGMYAGMYYCHCNSDKCKRCSSVCVLEGKREYYKESKCESRSNKMMSRE
jgi:hypothetical protein